jgi:hypothetical protein
MDRENSCRSDLQVIARYRSAPKQRIGDGLRRQKRCKPPQPYIGIDYSRAETPRSSLPGLRVYMAGGGYRSRSCPRRRPESIEPDAGSRNGRSRCSTRPRLTFVGIDLVPAAVWLEPDWVGLPKRFSPSS